MSCFASFILLLLMMVCAPMGWSQTTSTAGTGKVVQSTGTCYSQALGNQLELLMKEQGRLQPGQKLDPNYFDLIMAEAQTEKLKPNGKPTSDSLWRSTREMDQRPGRISGGSPEDAWKALGYSAWDPKVVNSGAGEPRLELSIGHEVEQTMLKPYENLRGGGTVYPDTRRLSQDLNQRARDMGLPKRPADGGLFSKYTFSTVDSVFDGRMDGSNGVVLQDGRVVPVGKDHGKGDAELEARRADKNEQLGEYFERAMSSSGKSGIIVGVGTAGVTEYNPTTKKFESSAYESSGRDGMHAMVIEGTTVIDGKRYYTLVDSNPKASEFRDYHEGKPYRASQNLILLPADQLWRITEISQIKPKSSTGDYGIDPNIEFRFNNYGMRRPSGQSGAESSETPSH